MNPKSQLLVFNRKEIVVIIVLLLLVAAFSFTLGIYLGGRLGATQMGKLNQTGQETAPLAEVRSHDKTVEPESVVATQDHEESEHDAPTEAAPSKPEGQMPAAALAEDRADAALVTETDRENLGVKRPVPMQLPLKRKAESGKYTLQIGSYRTLAEASDSVNGLKKQKLEAFYFEANVPGKGTWYRVGIGQYATKEQAESAGARLKSVLSSQADAPQFIVQKLSE